MLKTQRNFLKYDKKEDEKMNAIGFDNDAYIRLQSEQIRKRTGKFGGKLYIEFGGKLFDDNHASRVLPGFKPDSKALMLKALGSDAEAIVAVAAADIEKSKMRGDIGISYCDEVLRIVDAFSAIDINAKSIVITQYSDQPAVKAFKARLERLGLKVYRHYTIPNYPYDIQGIVSEEGFGKNDFVETKAPIVVVTAPGPGSGKMAVCLSQLYNENKRGNNAGYAKFETFPIWNIPLKHPVNLAYEAATADLNDVNMIDPYYLEAYGKTAVNYNRDVEAFPVLNAMFEKIYKKRVYNSPTDMGVNMVGNCIIDDEVCKKASKDEIVRRYFATLCAGITGKNVETALEKIELLMKLAEISVEDRKCVSAAMNKSEQTGGQPAVAIELNDGTIVTGKTSNLLGASAAALLNAIKQVSGIDDSVTLIAPEIIEPIQHLKVDRLGNHNPRLHSDEVLVALAICAATNPEAKKAMESMGKLKGCQAHSSVMLATVDSDVYRKLGINLTCEPRYQTKKLYHK